MKIVLYTSVNPSIVDKYNMHQLISKNQQYEYFIVAINQKILNPGPSGKSYLKYFWKRLLQGKDEWYLDNHQVYNRVEQLIETDPFQLYPVTLVPKLNGKIAEAVIKDIDPDIILQCGAGILKPCIFEIPRIGTINVHHGYAPEVRGISSVFWSILYGLPIGVTLHYIDKNLDTGKVISQYKSESNSVVYTELYYEIILKGAQLLSDGLKNNIQNTEDFIEESIDSYYFGAVDSKVYKQYKRDRLNIPLSRKGLHSKILSKKHSL